MFTGRSPAAERAVDRAVEGPLSLPPGCGRCHDGRVRATATSTDLDFVERFAVAAERFADAILSADLRSPVAGCPGWSTYDLVRHLGNVHAWAATIVETGRPAAHQDDQPRSRRPRVVREWYVGKAGDLFEVLRSCDPASECWTLNGPGSAGFWRRRQLHETTMHHPGVTVVGDADRAAAFLASRLVP
jgi:hypothetical protein